MHEGHRQRMYERLAQDGVLSDHELLEIMLFYAIPRKNTNGIAHKLLDAFGDLHSVLQANETQLKMVDGIGDAAASYLRMIGLLVERIKEVPYATQPVLSSTRSFFDYLTRHYRGMEREVLEIYCLDSKDRILFCADFSDSLRDSVEVSGEQLSRLIVNFHPKKIMAAHNHPHGPVTPSDEDDRFTMKLKVLCELNGVILCDHLIISGEEVYSYQLMERLGPGGETGGEGRTHEVYYRPF